MAAHTGVDGDSESHSPGGHYDDVKWLSITD